MFESVVEDAGGSTQLHKSIDISLQVMLCPSERVEKHFGKLFL